MTKHVVLSVLLILLRDNCVLELIMIRLFEWKTKKLWIGNWIIGTCVGCKVMKEKTPLMICFNSACVMIFEAMNICF